MNFVVVSTDLAKIKKHVTLTSASDVGSLIEPLKQYEVSFFNFYKEYHDGSIVRLSNHVLWSEHYFTQGYINKINKVPSIYLERKLNYFVWHKEDWPEMLIDAKINFDMGNGISIIKFCEDGIEYYGFGTDSHNYQMVNFFLNHLDSLNNFCDYFKEQAAALIYESEKDKIILPNYLCKEVSSPEFNLSGVVLSTRQISCSKLLLKGFTSKEIAAELNLSPRTVEDYITILKNKFNCRNKTELVLKLNNRIDI